MSVPSPSPDLIEALKNGRAIAIVGSGLSVQVGGPSWEDLLYGLLAEACEIRPEETDRIKAAFHEIKENHFLNAAGLLKELLGTGFTKAVVRQIDFKRELKPRKEIEETDNIIDAIFENCGRPEKRELVPSINHRMITQLPFRAIITTNYDTLLEQASPDEKKIGLIFTRSSPFLPKRVVESKWFLLKAHGSVDTHEDIILSRDDYQEALFGGPLHQVLDALFKTNEKFWIGYGHNDPTLDYLVDECKERLHLNGGFAVAKGTNYVLQRRFETASIQPSWLDDYSQISDYLRKLAEATDSPLIFEITLKREWTGERDAISYGKRIAEALSKLGGEFELFCVEEGSVKLYLETKAPILAEYRIRLLSHEPEILKIIKQFNISSFNGLDVSDLIRDANLDEESLFKSDQEGTVTSKSQFSVPRQIPPPPRDFKGREHDISDILSSFEKGAAITGVRGMGGVGKTALALKLAERIKDGFPDGQIFIDMRGTSTNPNLPALKPEEAMAHVIRAYNLTDRLPDNVNEMRGSYHSILTGKRILLLLDNASDAAQVEPLLPPAGCSVIITSRLKFTLPGLAEKDLDILPAEEARQLLLEIAPRIGSRADDLAKLCGYLPLALRNAASALAEKKDLKVSEYELRLKDKVARLELVKGSFSLSYDLLSPARKKQWSRLSVFPEDFDRNAATAVLKMAPGASSDALSDLVCWSLLDYVPTAGSEDGRYKLHDLARLFAESYLQGAELADAKQKHANHYSKVLSKASSFYDKGGIDLLDGLKLFDSEWANIKVGHAWIKSAIRSYRMLNKSDLKFISKLVWSYENGIDIISLRLHPREQISWIETGLSTARIMKDHKAEGLSLGNLGNRYFEMGEMRKATEFYEQALQISKKNGARKSEGIWLGNMGLAYSDLGDPRKAIELYEQALKIARETGNRRGEGNLLGNLGSAYSDLGDPRKAIELYEQALKIAREIGNRRGEGNLLGNLGSAYSDLGDPRKAIELYEQALKIARETGNRRGEGNLLGNLGSAYSDLGDPRKAIELYEQALKIAREIGNRRGEGSELGNLGLAYSDLGEPQKAIELYEQALVIAGEIADKQNESELLCNLGKAYLDLKEVGKTIDDCIKSLDLARSMEYRKFEGEALCTLGKAFTAQDEPQKALDYCDQALEIFKDIEYLKGEAESLFARSQALHQLGQTKEATSCAQQALAIFQKIESPLAEKVHQQLADWGSPQET